MNPLLTVAEVAAILRRSQAYVTGLILDGHLRVVQLPGSARPARTRGRKDYRIRQADLDAFLASSTTAAPRPEPAAKTRAPKAAPQPVGAGLFVWDGKRRLKI